jgi:hypothetical protein
MILFVSIYAISLIAFIIHLLMLKPQDRTWAKIVEILLLYQIVFSLGVTSIVAFLAFTIDPKYIADYTGWPASPFEQQLANVNLAFASLGILSIWLRGNFWTATILGFSIWILGDGIHHIFNSIEEGNYTLGNIGVPLWTDILVPAVLLILLKLYLDTLHHEL